MRRMIGWLRSREMQMILWANQRRSQSRFHRCLGLWLRTVTHVGGASFTLTSSFLVAMFAPNPWSLTGWQCFTAVFLSHLPVYVVKRKMKRLRPYQALNGVNTGKKPLVDSSFPSGHTTAIFAYIIPIISASSVWFPVIMPIAALLALSVAWSRMYLGLHYPSDVAAGALVGTLTALTVEYGWTVTLF
ncbi:phosphatase PAP2 family protein [Paenibacillus sp. YAF4_2]|uniref:phosphatase PAP2 family protein n=1 Tax=Paenibacillus sp. YAF4_2 TaxID=3233085 RepID=UPI003F9B82DC